MTRTAAGADGNFALGNLAGIAGAAVATDQSVYLGSGGWASYSLTAAGRALSGVAGTANTFPYFSAANVVTLGSVTSTGLSVLGAASQAAARTAIQAVGLVGAEAVAGIKTCSDAWRWNLSTAGSIQYANPGNQIGIIFRFGDPAGGDGSMYRNEVRFGQGLMNVFVNDVAGNATGTQGYFVNTTTLSPQVTNAMSCGSSGRVWTQVFATNTTISTSDARLKTEPRQLSEAERKAGSELARLPAIWEWLTGDRLHAGPTVQAAIAVMKEHGLDPFAYSFICYDEWEAEPEQWHEWPAEEAVYEEVPDPVYGENGTVLAVHRTKRVLVKEAVEAGRELIQPAREAGNRYSFRKEELLCFMVAALAAENDVHAAKVEALDARLAALEAKA
ncbi:tail fiber domain-containing protein [Stenotrophomonas maltophilia]|uniref:tail fiber domain-containing protein n=1 Tax=Stenotrophomonas maltophilia TaxID=40324 RepID=UPI0012FD4835|nr:tail fiber domain-containing protein [Stenotrophomonas maltophilia]